MNPIFGMINSGTNNSMIQQFSNFMNVMKGRNPQEEVNALLQSGRISQAQLNQAQQMAQQMSGMFSQFFR